MLLKWYCRYINYINKIKSEYDNIINGEGVKDIKDAENQTDTDDSIPKLIPQIGY
jgi:hypothetical protein